MSSNIAQKITGKDVAGRLAAISAPFPPERAEDLAVYLSMLMQWGRAMNLTGAATWREALENLVADSFYLAGFLDSLLLGENPFMLDPGAGAGLPGIPLRLVWPKGRYCMVEAREKRAIFLSTALARLKLTRTAVFRGRVEDFFLKNPDAWPDAVISRAFLPRPRVLAMFYPHMRPGGLAVFMANAPAPEEKNPLWKLAAEAPYHVPAGQRWFQAYCRN